MKPLIIATRESPLALWQANYVKEKLQALYPDLSITLKGVTTEGDKRLDVSLSKVGGKGLFVKELEHLLLSGEADLAVHSMKDVPMHLPEGLTIACLLARAEVEDVLVSRLPIQRLTDLPEGAIVGTSSLRRQSQCLAIRPDLTIRFIRGNLGTRLRKLDEGEFDAILLAAAGLNRLGLDKRISFCFSCDQFLPAVGQGALGLECREDDEDLKTLLKPLNDQVTEDCLQAERTMNQVLGGTCQSPIAGFATYQEQQLWLRGLVGMPDGQIIYRAEAKGERQMAKLLGKKVAESLLLQGAKTIIEQSCL